MRPRQSLGLCCSLQQRFGVSIDAGSDHLNGSISLRHNLRTFVVTEEATDNKSLSRCRECVRSCEIMHALILVQCTPDRLNAVCVLFGAADLDNH
jgi:hypothetical protein